MSAAAISAAHTDTPPAGLRLLTLRDFAHWPASQRPARVDATPRRVSAQQTAAWRRLTAWVYDETTRRALDARQAARA